MQTLTGSSVWRVCHVPFSRLFTVMRGSERTGGSQPPRLLFSTKRVLIGIKLPTESPGAASPARIFRHSGVKKRKKNPRSSRQYRNHEISKQGRLVRGLADRRERSTCRGQRSDQAPQRRGHPAFIHRRLHTRYRKQRRKKGQPADLHEQIRGRGRGRSREKRGRWELIMPSLPGDAAAKRHGRMGGEAGSRSAAAGVRRETHYADVAHRLAGNLTGEDCILEMVRKKWFFNLQLKLLLWLE